MVFSLVQHLVGGQNVSPLNDLQSALAGTEGLGTATTWEFADASGRKVIFKGTFTVLGGVVQDGTVSGFEVFNGAVKVMTGSGYALSDKADPQGPRRGDRRRLHDLLRDLLPRGPRG